MASFLTYQRIIPASGEREAQWHPRTATTKAVFYVRGFAGSASTQMGDRIAHQLAEQSFVVVAHDLGGGTTWGNAAFKSKANTVLTWMEARWAGIYAFAVSMGGVDVLNTLREYPSRIRATSLVAPACKLDALHDRDPGGLGAAIETAHGGAASYEAALPTVDPWRNTDTHTRDSLQLWYSTDDPTIIPSDVTDFANATRNTPISQGAVGHTADGVDVSRIVSFFRSR